jgi:hypothetical protein
VFVFGHLDLALAWLVMGIVEGVRKVERGRLEEGRSLLVLS